MNNKYKNIDFWTFTASTDGKYHINKKIHKIAVPCDDSVGTSRRAGSTGQKRGFNGCGYRSNIIRAKRR